jgi:hypothetical protein
VSHYYLAGPGQLLELIERHCVAWDEQQRAIFKKLLQDMLDSPTSIEMRVRMDVKDIEPVRATISGTAPKSDGGAS